MTRPTVDVHFILDVPEGTTDPVYITGSLPLWRHWVPNLTPMEGEGTERHFHVSVAPGTEIEYKFTQGSWERQLLDENGYISGNFRVVGDEATTVRHRAFGFGAGATAEADPDGLLVGLTGDRWRTMHPDFYTIFLFPEGRTKALVVSIDDSPPQDERLVAMLDAHGLRGTFHINSGQMDREGHLASSVVPALYRGHEVSCHTVSHPWLTTVSDVEARREILDDRNALEQLTDRPVRGIAYPFGAVDRKSLAILREGGFAYARTTGRDDDFSLPEDVLLWPGSCHQSEAVPTAERFFALPNDEMALLLVWGHAWELDRQRAGEPNSWESMEQFFMLAQEHADETWSATFLEVADYVDALSHAEVSADGLEVTNAGRQPI